jgi:hypothetical protein
MKQKINELLNKFNNNIEEAGNAILLYYKKINAINAPPEKVAISAGVDAKAFGIVGYYLDDCVVLSTLETKPTAADLQIALEKSYNFSSITLQEEEKIIDEIGVYVELEHQTPRGSQLQQLFVIGYNSNTDNQLWNELVKNYYIAKEKINLQKLYNELYSCLQSLRLNLPIKNEVDIFGKFCYYVEFQNNKYFYADSLETAVKEYFETLLLIENKLNGKEPLLEYYGKKIFVVNNEVLVPTNLVGQAIKLIVGINKHFHKNIKVVDSKVTTKGKYITATLKI